MYEHIHIYMHMYVYSCICIIKYHYYWYYCHYIMYSHCPYFCYCCYHTLYHVSYLHIRGQISGNSLERTSALLVCIGTASLWNLNACKHSVLPWRPLSCLEFQYLGPVKVAAPAACHTCHLGPSLASPLKRQWKTARHDPLAESKYIQMNHKKRWPSLNCLIWIQDLGDRWNQPTLALSSTVCAPLHTQTSHIERLPHLESFHAPARHRHEKKNVEMS